jgi:hypothetical protein
MTYALTWVNLQALKHYGESIRCGHKHVLQSLPRLLTLYFDFGREVTRMQQNNKEKQALLQVIEHRDIANSVSGLVRPHGPLHGEAG